ncbi:MAG: cysteine desulfurase [Bacteroidia bacterium]|nr:MAG: cysteine desulfurase [Bacteroidia bacterium]
MAVKEDILRKQFPILGLTVNKRPLVYFDNAATTQKPVAVIDRLRHYYESENSNIHRGAHYLSQLATEAYEQARENIRKFINAGQNHEVIFTRGTTESINLVAYAFSKKFLNPGDEVLISEMEHHSNIVPWQIACENHQAHLKIIPMNEKGELRMDQYRKLLSEKTKLVAVTHVSNSLGTINPVKEIIQLAHQNNTAVLVDGAQAAPHIPIDVKALDCDFYCFSGHKMYGPMGVGVLFGKEKWLEQMPPYQSGGEMIKEVSFKKTTYNELPFKFEAGTPNVADVLGMEKAIQFILEVGHKAIARHENDLLQYAINRLSELENIRFIGTAEQRTSVVSFLFNDIHPYDTGTILDKLGIAVRTGHHCAQPVMDHFQIPGTVRISFALYNTKEEIDVLVKALAKVREMFG